MEKYFKNLEVQFEKVFRHTNTGSFKTRERYKKAFIRFIHFLATVYHLQKLSNISEKHIRAYVEKMKEKGLSAATIKTELSAIRFFHDAMPFARNELPENDVLELERRSFGGVDRTWTNREFNLMLAVAMNNDRSDYVTMFTLGRYSGLRLEECFRIDTNDAKNALKTGELFVKGKGGLKRFVPINNTIRIMLKKMIAITPAGHKLFVLPNDKTHLAMKRLECFIVYHRKAFTDNKITFHGLRHTYAHEKYEEFIKSGMNDIEARRSVSELLGHHRDDVTRIYLASDFDREER